MFKNWNLFEKLLLAVSFIVGVTIFCITKDYVWLAWLGLIYVIALVVDGIKWKKKEKEDAERSKNIS